MARNLFILAAILALATLIATGLALTPSVAQPGLPSNGSPWRTVALMLLAASLITAAIGVFTRLFEQVERRAESAREAARQKRHQS